ncbi:YcaO-like family protein [Rhizobium herbae]|uniref:Thiazole/oxazole-forming peptide maturase SagD family component n=1 Tax=Rhizobium herbae TaxID=508661 RepID=A0ABS4EUE0_9HYPH|nr:YcaO-like family protein [Rhizobium herbae]MBP1861547.1 thiazole/oxazole-forming peptide maturase SagD family component [Rhizobium herbae]
MSNAQSLRRMAARLTGIQTIRPPGAPGAVIVMALLPQANRPMTFAGCNLDATQAFQACVGEAAEFLAQSDPRAATAMPVPDDAITVSEVSAAQQPQQWLRAMTFPEGRLVSLPAASCCYLPESAHLDISTGCAAGRSIEEALLHAMCEIIERDAARRWWGGSHAARGIDASHPALMEAIAWLTHARRAVCDRDVILLDIGGDAVIPVIAAASFLKNGKGFVLATAAHPDITRAATGAVRELVQMEFGLLLATIKRDRAGPFGLGQTDLRHLRRAETVDPGFPALKSLAPTVWCHDQPHAQTDPAVIARRLIDRGHQVFAARLSSDPFLPVVRMLVTHMPIAMRANTLTYNDGLWNGVSATELY